MMIMILFVVVVVVVVVGISLLQLHYASMLDVSSEAGLIKTHLESALRTIKPFLRLLDTHRPTFLCGAAGPLAIAAILYHKLGKATIAAILYHKLGSHYSSHLVPLAR